MLKDGALLNAAAEYLSGFSGLRSRDSKSDTRKYLEMRGKALLFVCERYEADGSYVAVERRV
jgi:hypothetical protein